MQDAAHYMVAWQPGAQSFQTYKVMSKDQRWKVEYTVILDKGVPNLCSCRVPFHRGHFCKHVAAALKSPALRGRPVQGFMDLVCPIYMAEHSLKVWKAAPVVPPFTDLEHDGGKAPPLKPRRKRDKEKPGPKPGSRAATGLTAADLAALFGPKKDEGGGEEDRDGGSEGGGGGAEGEVEEEAGFRFTGEGFKGLLSQASAVPDMYEEAAKDPARFTAPPKSLAELAASEAAARSNGAGPQPPKRGRGGSIKKNRYTSQCFAPHNRGKRTKK
jgi:hypothetical protein